MPIQGYTPNRNLVKIAPGSTDGWDVWYNQTLDALDAPSLVYQIAAAQNLNPGQVAAIKDNGLGVKQAYLAASGTYTFGDPLGLVTETVLAGASTHLTLAGRALNNAWAFGSADTFAYLSASGAVTTAPTATKLGYVLSPSSIFFIPGGGSGGGSSITVNGSNGIQNTGTPTAVNLAPVYGSQANTVCQGNDARLHSQNTDGGTSAASFEINYTTVSGIRLLTTGITANRDFTFPNATTKLMGESASATITVQHWFSPTTAKAPFILGANAQGQLVTGLNADQLDGQHAADFAASSHNHTGVYEPANANIQSHIASTANPHTVTAAQVGNATAQWNASKLQGINVSAAAPANGQELLFNAALNQWEPSTPAAGGGSSGSGLKNAIINGACMVAQRAVPNLSTSAQYGKVDRFLAFASGGAVSAGTITQDAAAAIGTSGYAMHLSGVTLTGAGALTVSYRMESKDAKQFINKSASFSVSVLHDVGAGVNYTIKLNKANTADTFSAVTNIATSSATSVPSGVDTLLKFENVAMGACGAGVEIQIVIACGAVSVKNFRFAEFQLEQSATSTTFEFRPFHMELAACQRYYETGSREIYCADVANGNFYYRGSKYLVAKRATPTITYTDIGNSGFAAGAPVNIANNADYHEERKQANATVGGGYYIYSWTSDAEL